MQLSGRSLCCTVSPGGIETKLVPERFAETDYTRFSTGKWHNGQKTLERSFPSGRLKHLGGMSPQVQPVPGSFGSLEPEEYEGRATSLFAVVLISLLNRRKVNRNSLFTYCSFSETQCPQVANPAALAIYKGRELGRPRPWFPAPQIKDDELLIRREMMVQPSRAMPALIDGLLCSDYRARSKHWPDLEDSSRFTTTGEDGDGVRHLRMTVHKDVEGSGALLYFASRDFHIVASISSAKTDWIDNAWYYYGLAAKPYKQHKLIGATKKMNLKPFVDDCRRPARHFEDPIEMSA